MQLRFALFVSFQRRLVPGDRSYSTTDVSASVPHWVKLERNGDTFKGYQSTNESNWSSIGLVTLAMASNLYVGLAVTAHKNSTLNTATLTGVQIQKVTNGGDPPPAGSSVKLETGNLALSSSWTRVNFSQNFSDPVVVATPPSYNTGIPGVIRMRNVNSNGFEIRTQAWDYLQNAEILDSVNYLVMERGSYKLSDGTRLEAGRVNTDKVQSFVPVTFAQSFNESPVVVTSVATYNGHQTVTTRIRNVRIRGFDLAMQEQEAYAPSHATETITYIAWEPSRGSLNGQHFEVNRTSDVVTHNFYTIKFQDNFSTLPVFLANMQTGDGMNTTTLRYRNLSKSSAEVKLEEEQSGDNEINHGTEVVGYVLIEPDG